MLWLSGLALAGTVYINGVRVDLLPVVTLQGATVRMDQNGDIWIDAPNYKVQVVGGAPSPTSAQASATSAVSTPDASGRVWYLVSEDEGSVDGVVDVFVNDQYVRRLQSGQSQVLVDLSAYVHRGSNKVQFVVRTAPTGRLGAYVGAGDNTGEALRIDAPPVTWRSAGAQTVQDYTFTVP